MYFATNSVTSSRRRATWQDVIASTCGAFQTTFSPQDVNGAIETAKIGGLNCAKINQVVQHISRTSSDIRADKTDHCFLVLQLSGRAELMQDERQLSLKPGDVVLLDSADPFQMALLGTNSQMCVHIPKDELADRVSGWRIWAGCKLPSPSNFLVQSLVNSAFGPGENVSAEQAGVLSDAIIGLVATSWQEAPVKVGDRPSDRLRDIQNYLLLNLASEDLSPRCVAATMAVSERCLHRLFAASGASLSQWIREARLQRCSSSFRDPSQRGRSITEVAYSWGFNDSAHFSRAFRDFFGVSPREYRKEAASTH